MYVYVMPIVNNNNDNNNNNNNNSNSNIIIIIINERKGNEVKVMLKRYVSLDIEY